MPPVQTSFQKVQDAYVVGAPVLSRYDSDSRVVETAAGIGFGQPVSRGSDDMGCVISAAYSDATFLGISFRDPTRPPTDGDKYARYVPLGYMERGSIALQTGVAVNDGDPVWYNKVTKLWEKATGDDNIGPFTGWVWDTTLAAAGIAVAKKV